MSDDDYQKTYTQQRYPTAAEVHQVLERNPEAARRGACGSMSSSCATSMTCNDSNKDTQFADYHGHGWNFAASSSATGAAIC